MLFAGYRNPHPLDYRIELTVRTDGKITPLEALQLAIDDLVEELETMETAFDRQIEFV